MSMYGQFKADQDLETAGITLDYGEFRIKVARAGGSNTKFSKVFEKYSRPYRRSIQLETITEEQSNEIMYMAFADAVVLDWEVRQKTEDKNGNEKIVWKRGIEAADGSVIAFNRENVIATFIALPDLFTDIYEQANKLALFRETIREDDAGN